MYKAHLLILAALTITVINNELFYCNLLWTLRAAGVSISGMEELKQKWRGIFLSIFSHGLHYFDQPIEFFQSPPTIKILISKVCFWEWMYIFLLINLCKYTVSQLSFAGRSFFFLIIIIPNPNLESAAKTATGLLALCVICLRENVNKARGPASVLLLPVSSGQRHRK